MQKQAEKDGNWNKEQMEYTEDNTKMADLNSTISIIYINTK